jgi:molecular chaperone HtpG
MPLIPPVPDSLTDCAVYRALERKDTPSHGLVDRVITFVRTAEPLLEAIIGGPFAHYTLHNPQHARRLVHLAEYIVSPQTLEKCSALDCALLIQSCYFHDLGLSLSENERKVIVASDEFQQSVRSWPELEADLASARLSVQQAKNAPDQSNAEALVFQLQEAALAAYLRPRA